MISSIARNSPGSVAGVSPMRPVPMYPGTDRIEPDRVHDRLAEHVLVDGFRLVLDTAASSGAWIVDARDGTRYLDLYAFFASAPLGLNPPGITGDPDFLATLGEVAVNKPANSDIYTTHFAEFVATFDRVLGDPDLPHLFFIEGGALAVENALKAAFDWKSRHNELHGRDAALGTKVLHLTRAFHGRSGYTMSLTNTDPFKTARFPTFDWPRIDVPAIRFPLADHLAEVEAAERRALTQAEAAFAAHPHDIACFIAEPIQGEGGDNHLRPEFLRAMQELCHAHDALFVLDEVQTGVGATGTAWAYQQFGLEPDLVAFSKKAQVGGIMGGRRVDEVPDNVFALSGRINSTWGGGLVDMVRARRYLEIIERDDVFAAVRTNGAWFLAALEDLAGDYPDLLSQVRGRGLMIAVDLPSADVRDEVIRRLRTEQHVLVLPSGARAIRFRPALTISREELELAVTALRAVVSTATSTTIAAITAE